MVKAPVSVTGAVRWALHTAVPFVESLALLIGCQLGRDLTMFRRRSMPTQVRRNLAAQCSAQPNKLDLVSRRRGWRG